MVCGLPAASSCTTRSPVRIPGPEGLKTTTKGCVFPLAGTDVGSATEAGLRENSGLEIVALVMLRVAVPALVIVKGTDGSSKLFTSPPTMVGLNCKNVELG